MRRCWPEGTQEAIPRFRVPVSGTALPRPGLDEAHGDTKLPAGGSSLVLEKSIISFR